ncbi:putative AMP dependent ligase/synthetase [Macroventuria anomochaeta]|uniref:AMP dependent ligase/synthetase n=1 Tax=Macroventuria anomochaeta TaxID=301207 RepID=A0ACB6SGF4_9PLEO|nr:putative AMP dependent ligase/synthetase [Macroventuria anomochaeta]KAF2633109.1 putative AMP dependent ligase/synthetase [Macroventuria anomochaeta]
MIFTAPDFLPTLPAPLPLQETIGDFCLTANLAKTAGSDSVDKRPPFVEAAIDRAWTADEIGVRVAQVAAALFASWRLVPGQEWNKVVAILASNSVDTLILSWAIHRIGGGCLMLQPTSSADEIAEHLDRIPPFAMFVSQDLLPLGEEAVRRSSNSSKLPVYRLSVPDRSPPAAAVESDLGLAKIPTLDDLLAAAKELLPMHKTPLAADEATRRVAYYCTTSGTSGFQRIVAITHKNMIASILQATSFYKATRERGSEVTLGFLPFNHIYGLLITHSLMYYGDSLIVHRGFNLMEILTSIVKYRINTLYLVPPIINALSRNASILDRFDLSSVNSIVSGGGPLNKEAFTKMQAARPNWRILSGWGQTESCGIGSLSHPSDIFPGSSGVLLPDVRIRLRDDSGREVEKLEEMGEIEIASPSVLRGYIDHANDALLPSAGDEELWWPTGDVGLFRVSPSGETHLFVVDRIRDMIKVKGNQVAPGQIEAHLSKHAAVAETAVVGVPDEVAGERALAFIVREPSYASSTNESDLRKTIRDYNDLALPEVCRLQDRIIFIDQIPKSASGKVLKGELRKKLTASAP